MASALITGTSSGIGLATVLAFGRAGHTVFATMRNPARAPQLGETVAAEELPVQILTLDVDSDTSVADALSEIRHQGGRSTCSSTMLVLSAQARSRSYR